jgi:hypothetical protein
MRVNPLIAMAKMRSEMANFVAHGLLEKGIGVFT